MTKTIVESSSKAVTIGLDEPFCIIGERINPTGRKKLALELEAGNFETVIKDALEQVKSGANILDINAGVVYNSNPNPNETEPVLMKRLLEIVQDLVDVPLCIDSSVPGALEEGLKTAKGRPLLNSVTGEEERLESILPLVKKYNVPVVAISNDDTGISEDPEIRFQVAKKIVERASDFGIQPNDIIVDPLVMPIGAMPTAGQQVFELVKKLKEELKVNTTCGASNISFGLPNNLFINAFMVFPPKLPQCKNKHNARIDFALASPSDFIRLLYSISNSFPNPSFKAKNLAKETAGLSITFKHSSSDLATLKI